VADSADLLEVEVELLGRDLQQRRRAALTAARRSRCTPLPCCRRVASGVDLLASGAGDRPALRRVRLLAERARD
jgi:hypothetical protein